MSLKYLVTILYRPRATMRRILASASRWSPQIVILAAVCTSIAGDTREIGQVLPGMTTVPLIATLAIGIVANALAWLVFWLILSWITAGIGKLLGGRGTNADVRAAFAWALVPAIWSPIFRIPFTVYTAQLHYAPTKDVHRVVLDFVSHGGCSLIVLYLFLLFVSEIGCFVLACFTLAEAERFSTQKGFLAVFSTVVVPVLVILAAVFSFRS
jgi:Yip1-like protein